MASPSENFDYVIIGGGTAGLVVAGRLAENPETKILVLEAGGNHLNNPLVKSPVGWPALLETEADWNYTTAPQEGLLGRCLTSPQGRALGGSSAINAQMFVVPSKANINSWKALGNESWDFEQLKPYLQKFDQQEQGNERSPVKTITRPTAGDPTYQAWGETLEHAGLTWKDDHFDDEAVGGFTIPMTMNGSTGERSYTANTYLKPAMSNLKIITDASVSRILLEGSQPDVVATGVEYVHDGATKTAKAGREVILAAGTYGSPKILELSGIGGAALLNKYGIDVVIDNSHVGENLRVHIGSGFNLEAADDSKLEAKMVHVGYLPGSDLENYGGPLKQLLDDHPANASDTPQEKVVREQLQNSSNTAGLMFFRPGQLNWGSKTFKEFFVPQLEGKFLSFTIWYTNPLSSGSVHIASPEPSKYPIVDPKHFSNPIDIEIFARLLLRLKAIAHTAPMAGFLKPSGKTNLLYAKCNELQTKDDAILYARSTATGTHDVGTCAMLPLEKGGVVSENLIVYGTKNLRVVDASIIPCVPRSNTMATVYAVAERAADIVKSDSK